MVAVMLDILWCYLGYAGFFTMVDDNRWNSGGRRRKTQG
jgi:hypothetical protein